jgi:hypothetical protein
MFRIDNVLNKQKMAKTHSYDPMLVKKNHMFILNAIYLKQYTEITVAEQYCGHITWYPQQTAWIPVKDNN